jgi:LemA protein
LIDGVKIEGNENRINVERQRYNDIVRDYNTLIMKFPTNMMAKLFGFLSKSYFELVNPEANQAPTIAPDISF